MNVLIVNTYFWGGGAEKISRQLYYGLKKKGIHTFFMAGRLQEDVPKDVGIIHSFLVSRCITTGIGMLFHNTLFRTVLAKKKIIACIKKNKIDIVHFHNIHSNYLGIQDVKEIAQYCKGVIFTLHDMWLLTGCCAHAMECEEWKKSRCKGCQGNALLKHKSFWAGNILRMKEENLGAGGYCFAVPSEWLYRQCQQSYLSGQDVRIIHNGIDLKVFIQQNKLTARKKYHIGTEKNVLLFAANGTRNVFKGFSYLLEALKNIENKNNYMLLVVGNDDEIVLDSEYEVHKFGYIKDPRVMNEIYGMADVFVMPSIAETFPLASIEAMASGTPVLAFSAGGLCEQIDPEVGWLVKCGDSRVLSDKIQEIFKEKGKLAEKARNARRRVEELYDEQKMLDQYKEVYESILKERRE